MSIVMLLQDVQITAAKLAAAINPQAYPAQQRAALRVASSQYSGDYVAMLADLQLATRAGACPRRYSAHVIDLIDNLTTFVNALRSSK